MHHQFLALLPVLASIASAASTTPDESVQKAHNVLMDAIDKQESKLALQAFTKAASLHADHDAIKPSPATSPAAKQVFLQAKIVQANDLSAFGPISYAILDEAKMKEDLASIGPDARVKQVKAQLEAAWKDLTKERAELLRRSGEGAAAAGIAKVVGEAAQGALHGVEAGAHAASGSAAVHAAEQGSAKIAAEAGEQAAAAAKAPAAARPEIEPIAPETPNTPKITEEKPKGLFAKWKQQLKERTHKIKEKWNAWKEKGKEAREAKKTAKEAKKTAEKAEKAAKKGKAATDASEAKPTFKQNFVTIFKSPRVQIASAVLALATVGIVLYDIFKPVKAPAVDIDNMDDMMADSATDGLDDEA